MGERFFRELTTVDKKQDAACDAVRWGFPREVTRKEIDKAYWFRFGGDVVFWYESVSIMPDSLWIHIAAKPGVRRWLVPTRRWLIGSEVIGELLGAEQLRFIPIEGEREVHQHLTSLGWEPDEFGLHKRLGV